ncbi:pentapeptide repeat-containing protein [Streptomyces sp. NPDC059460]|uniref:pentapeptide repeat-containing protein n=1 Tax=Streptomyces sp. NPDC059460 TaxID=3346840 RepID=UPI0036CDAE54
MVKQLLQEARKPHAQDVAVIPRRANEPPRGRYTPKLWSVWLVAPLALLVAGAAGYLICQGVDDLLAHAADRAKPPKPVDVNDVIKTTITILTLVGVVLAGIYAYRRQRLAEGDAHRADASQLAERYTTAAEQLGHDKPAVRLAGVYALARLADDWEEQRQVCVDVLCAYLRMPYETDPTSDKYKEGEREVRHTIIRVIRDHLREPQAPTSWCTCNLDFTGATFDGGDLSRSHFRSTVSFANATFSGGGVYFGGAAFSGSRITFANAAFNGGTVSLSGATFGGGTVSFDNATFSGTVISWGPIPPPAGST